MSNVPDYILPLSNNTFPVGMKQNLMSDDELE